MSNFVFDRKFIHGRFRSCVPILKGATPHSLDFISYRGEYRSLDNYGPAKWAEWAKYIESGITK